MPLGWERINTKKSTPNKNIVFIKSKPGPDENVAKDYLERIAAQCLPIMNKHHLAVVSLEEYEPNLEFWGRNFNNGEVIQLVLKSPSTGHWLPFKFVQMVMMHELAHNKQMNHSKAFWAVRNEFSGEMKALWDRDYTGDGLWGRGVLLDNGLFDREALEDGEVLPEHMCGGTFRSRSGGKRKVKPKITYKERQEKRIKKKFGANGVTLGADEEIKAKLEKGKRPVGKPRVAGSARGRELRAAAALARFEVKEDPHDDDLVTDSETGSDMEDEFVIKTEPNDVIDIDGKPLVDSKGHGMVRVCEDEDKNDDDAKRELEELQTLPSRSQQSLSFKGVEIRDPPSSTTGARTSRPVESSKPFAKTTQQSGLAKAKVSFMRHERAEESRVLPIIEIEKSNQLTKPRSSVTAGACSACSVENDTTALTCMVCSNVLKPEFVPNSWRCRSPTCKDGNYINAGDVGLCGICATRKCSDGI